MAYPALTKLYLDLKDIAEPTPYELGIISELEILFVDAREPPKPDRGDIGTFEAISNPVTVRSELDKFYYLGIGVSGGTGGPIRRLNCDNKSCPNKGR